MAQNKEKGVFFSVLVPVPGYGLIAPYAMPTPWGVVWVEVCYQFRTGKFMEVRMNIPEQIKEVEPHEIKD